MTQDSQESQVPVAPLDLREQMDHQVLLVLVDHLVDQETLVELDFPATLVIKVWPVAMVFQDHQDKRVNQVLQALAAKDHLEIQDSQGLKETPVFKALLVVLDSLVQRVIQDFLGRLAHLVL